jgi:YD repeat-containing protein
MYTSKYSIRRATLYAALFPFLIVPLFGSIAHKHIPGEWQTDAQPGLEVATTLTHETKVNSSLRAYPGHLTRHCTICNGVLEEKLLHLEIKQASWLVRGTEAYPSRGAGENAEFLINAESMFTVTFTAQVADENGSNTSEMTASASTLPEQKRSGQTPTDPVETGFAVSEGCGDQDCSSGQSDYCDECGSCDEALTVALGSLSIRVPLGHTAFGLQSVGHLAIHEDRPSLWIATPARLRLVGNPDLAEVIRTSDGYVRQVRSFDQLTDVVTISDTAYTMSLYHVADIGPKVGELYSVSGEPKTAILVERLDSPIGQGAHLRLTYMIGGQEHVNDFVYDFNANEWSLTKRNGDGSEANGSTPGSSNYRSETVQRWQAGDQTHFSREVRDKAGRLVSESTRTVQAFSWGTGMVESTLNPRGRALSTTYTYTTDGLLMGTVRSDGQWQYRAYDAEGRIILRTRNYGNQRFTMDANAARARVYTYQPFGDDDGSFEPWKPRMVLDLVNGCEIARRYYSYTPTQRMAITTTRSGASWNDPENLVTVTALHADGVGQGRPKLIAHPGGLFEEYSYEVSKDATTLSTTSIRGWREASGMWSSGQKTIRVVGAFGQELSNTVIDLKTGLVIARSLYSDHDKHYRPQRIDFLDGTFELRRYACCGLEFRRDRSGRETHYAYDSARRLAIAQTGDVALMWDYDPEGRVLGRSRQGRDGSLMRLSSTRYDLAGEVLSDWTAVKGDTVYNYSVDPNGLKTETVIYSDGGTRVTTFNGDQSIERIIGSAVRPMRYEYSLAEDSGMWVETVRQIELDAQGKDTENWRTEYFDRLGRSYKVEYSDGSVARTDYDKAGRLSRQLDCDGVRTLFSYDDHIGAETVAVDVNGNGQIDLNGPDRITRIKSSIQQRENLTLERTVIEHWPNPGESAPEMLQLREVSLNGPGTTYEWNFGPGGTSMVKTEFLPNGVKYIWNTDLRGTECSVYTNELLYAVAKADTNDATRVVRQYQYDPHGRLSRLINADASVADYTYDGADRPLSIVTSNPLDPNQKTSISMRYDAVGHLISRTAADGTQQEWLFSPLGHTISERHNSGPAVVRSYDSHGRLVSTRLHEDDGRPDLGRADYVYDKRRGWLVSKTSYGKGDETYQYSASGRLKARQRGRDELVEYYYDAAGEVTAIQYTAAATNRVNIERDRTGRVVKASKGDLSCSRSYGEFDRITGKVKRSPGKRSESDGTMIP